MPTHCCVPLCKKAGPRIVDGRAVSFHRFPSKEKNEQLHLKWCSAIRCGDVGKSFRISKYTKVCSLHFKDSDFIQKLFKTKRDLLPDAVPSLFAWSTIQWALSTGDEDSQEPMRKGKKHHQDKDNGASRKEQNPLNGDQTMDIKDEPNDDDYVDFTWEQSPVTGEELNEDVGENSTTGTKGKGRGKRRQEQGHRQREKERRQENGEKEERMQREDQMRSSEEENDDDDAVSAAGSTTDKRNKSSSYAFPVEHEESLVQFFSENDCFYNRGSRLYSNPVHKENLVAALATDLKSNKYKVMGWFKNQRTAVGKLYKRKSWQTPEQMTARQRWQLSSFSFLREYIVPRSYTTDTAKLPCAQSPTSDDSEAEVLEMSVLPAKSASTSGETYRRGRKRSKRLDDAQLEFISHPRPSEEVFKKSETVLAAQPPTNERTALGQWLLFRINKVPDDRWEAFQDAAQDLMREYTRPLLLQPTQGLQKQQPTLPPVPSWPQQQQPHQQWPQSQQEQQWLQPPPQPASAVLLPRSHPQSNPPAV